MDKQGKQKLIGTDNSVVGPRGGGGGGRQKRVKRVKHMGTEGDWTSGDKHNVVYKWCITVRCTLETYAIIQCHLNKFNKNVF